MRWIRYGACRFRRTENHNRRTQHDNEPASVPHVVNNITHYLLLKIHVFRLFKGRRIHCHHCLYRRQSGGSVRPTVDTHRQFNSDDIGLNQLLTEYCDLFDGIGEFPGEHSHTLHTGAKPVAHPPHRVPVALRDKVKQELACMEKFGIITKVTEPTDWVHSMVVAHKRNGDLRMCLDPRGLNAAIKRPHYTQELETTTKAHVPLITYIEGCSFFRQEWT
ncbi:hypothetical protein LSAT2_030550 [Lamellibrachia satsuma]|nr:hypothetical protein LSAT2_030550 [Lamellibrachia satsuma]